MIKVTGRLPRTVFFWLKSSPWKHFCWFYLRADSFLLSIAVMVMTSVCAIILPYWLGISGKSSHCLLDSLNVTVRQLASDKQAIWQSIKFDAKTLAEDEQPGSIHSYLISVVLDKNIVLIFCEFDCAIIVRRSNTSMRVILSECWD